MTVALLLSMLALFSVVRHVTKTSLKLRKSVAGQHLTHATLPVLPEREPRFKAARAAGESSRLPREPSPEAARVLASMTSYYMSTVCEASIQHFIRCVDRKLTRV